MGSASQLLSVHPVNGASVKLAGQGRAAGGRTAGGPKPGVSTAELVYLAMFVCSCVPLLKHLWC